MTKKCLISAVTFSVFSAVCLIAMHLMLLADISKWVGVGCGGAILIISLAVYLIFFRKSKRNVVWITLFSAVGCGLSISSMYVHVGSSPAILESLIVWGVLFILFFGYCFFTNIPFLKNHPRISLLIFCPLVLTGAIVGICVSPSNLRIAFSLAIMMLILFYIFLITIAVDANDAIEHFHHLIYASFTILFIVIIVVLVVLSNGDFGDGLCDGLTPSVPNKKKNPYAFTNDGFISTDNNV